MKSFKNFSILIIFISLFSSCSSAQKLVTEPPLTFGEVYFQKWVTGIRDGGSGIDLHIPVTVEVPKNTEMDSVYFRGKVVKLQKIKDSSNFYIGRFKSDLVQKRDIVMSIDTKKEYGNEAPNLGERIPFELKNDECVISYKEAGKTKYFKIVNIIEKPSQNYPSSQLNRQ